MAQNKTAAQWREETSERLAHIEEKLDHINGTVSDHERRIRRSEQWIWMVSGLAAAGGGLVGTLIGKV